MFHLQSAPGNFLKHASNHKLTAAAQASLTDYPEVTAVVIDTYPAELKADSIKNGRTTQSLELNEIEDFMNSIKKMKGKPKATAFMLDFMVDMMETDRFQKFLAEEPAVQLPKALADMIQVGLTSSLGPSVTASNLPLLQVLPPATVQKRGAATSPQQVATPQASAPSQVSNWMPCKIFHQLLTHVMACRQPRGLLPHLLTPAPNPRSRPRCAHMIQTNLWQWWLTCCFAHACRTVSGPWTRSASFRQQSTASITPTSVAWTWTTTRSGWS
jgi:hypothetical protein